MAKIRNNAPSKFLSLFVPQIDWFQKLLAEAAKEGSLSSRLLDLVIEDLRTRKLLTREEARLYDNYTRPNIKATRFTKDRIHSTFSLYIPKREGQEWIREKLEASFLKENCGAKNRSIYVWDLFVQENAKKLTKAQLREWLEEIAPASEKTKGA